MEELLGNIETKNQINYVELKGHPTVQKISLSEFSRLCSVRVSELENDSHTYLPAEYNVKMMSLLEIAIAEIKLKLCPYKIRREIVSYDGKTVYYENIDVNKCLIPTSLSGIN